LLDLGADINAQDQDGATPLHYAIQRGSVRTIKKLLIRGANKAIPKFDKKTAYELALENNQFEVAKILQSKSLIKQYLCLETEIEPMRPSRNDLFLLVTNLMIIIFKLIYIFKINLMLNLNSQMKYLEDYVSCTFDTGCLFESIITYSSLLLDACILFIVVYFMCCDYSRILFKSNKKNYSKSISVKK
jgi:ankyrin repeat protein